MKGNNEKRKINEKEEEKNGLRDGGGKKNLKDEREN